MSKPLALVVEDHPDLADIIAAALQAAGFLTEIADDGLVALRRLAQITPDLITLDLHLPGADGEEILRHIRQDSRLAPVRVVLLTAEQQQAKSLDELADLVLLKPISFEQLRDLARRILEPERKKPQ